MDIRWVSDHDLPPLVGKGLIFIKKGKVEAVYYAAPVPSDWGEGWELHKYRWDEFAGATITSEVYHVNLDGPRSTCDCMGFLQHQHCKHVDTMLELQRSRPQ